MSIHILRCFFLPLKAGKGFWSEMLGVGDFYYELGVQIIEVCLALKHRNGGMFLTCNPRSEHVHEPSHYWHLHYVKNS